MGQTVVCEACGEKAAERNFNTKDGKVYYGAS